MKKFFFTLLLTFTISILWANPEKDNSLSSSSSTEDLDVKDRDVNASGTGESETESTDLNQEDGTLEHETDSSEYSVNKFNYLFYLIYKVKFLDFEETEPELNPEVSLQE